MKFTEHRDLDLNMIQHYAQNEVRVNQHTIRQSCIITQRAMVTDWPVHSFEALTTSHLQALLDFKPEVLILGTGEQQHFPAIELFGFCAQQGISLEVMSNASACRTYNVLTTEDRIVVLGLILG